MVKLELTKWKRIGKTLEWTRTIKHPTKGVIGIYSYRGRTGIGTTPEHSPFKKQLARQVGWYLTPSGIDVPALWVELHYEAIQAGEDELLWKTSTVVLDREEAEKRMRSYRHPRNVAGCEVHSHHLKVAAKYNNVSYQQYYDFLYQQFLASQPQPA